MIELVLVIVVLGIIATLAIPRMERDLKQEAADNILSAIRYTQHLALVDDKQEFDDSKWQQRFWHLYFGTCTGSDRFYAIGSDDNKESSTNARVDKTEAALDPSNGKPIWWQDAQDCSSGGDDTVSPNIFITKKYSVDSITSSGGCANKYIAFDHLGRPYSSDFSSSTTPDNQGYMTSVCTFTFSLHNGDQFSIKIEPETGYAYIDGQTDS